MSPFDFGKSKKKIRSSPLPGASAASGDADAVDLLRVAGLTTQYAELLVAVGVHGVADLRDRTAGRLADAMLAVAAEREPAQLVPSASVIEGWIKTAGRLEPRPRDTTNVRRNS